MPLMTVADVLDLSLNPLFLFLLYYSQLFIFTFTSLMLHNTLFVYFISFYLFTVPHGGAATTINAFVIVTVAIALTASGIFQVKEARIRFR